jgi:hypothetical protein
VKAGVATAEHSEGGYRDSGLHGWHERTRSVLHAAREYRRRKEVEGKGRVKKGRALALWQYWTGCYVPLRNHRIRSVPPKTAT